MICRVKAGKRLAVRWYSKQMVWIIWNWLLNCIFCESGRTVIHSMNTRARARTQQLMMCAPPTSARGVRGHELKHSDVLTHHLFKLKTRKGNNCIVFGHSFSPPKKKKVQHIFVKFGKKGLLWLHAGSNLSFSEMLNDICNHNWHERLKGCSRRWKLVDVAHFFYAARRKEWAVATGKMIILFFWDTLNKKITAHVMLQNYSSNHVIQPYFI